MSGPAAPRPTSCRWAALGLTWLLLAGTVAACTPASRPGALDTGPFPEIASEVGSERETGRNPRPVAVGYDADGCLMYRLDAPDRQTIQAVVYRTLDGRITFDRGMADCSPRHRSARTVDPPAGGG